MTNSERIIALAHGVPVGEVCPYAVTSKGECNPSCPDCHGTGHIRTESENDAERAVAQLRTHFDTRGEALDRSQDVHDEALRVVMLERDEARQALEAERAAHQATRLQADHIIIEKDHAHEETKRRLAEVRQGLLEGLLDWRVLHERRVAERDEALRDLRNLLTVIHRDGGHYTEATGVSRSVQDAHEAIAQERVALDNALREKAALEADYQKIIAEVLLCDPQPASTRADDQLEPPWEVIARLRREKAEAEMFLGHAREQAATVETAAKSTLAAAELSRAQMREALWPCLTHNIMGERNCDHASGDACIAHMDAVVKPMLLATPDDGLLGKVRALCAVVVKWRAAKDCTCGACVEMDEALTALYAALPSLKGEKS